MIFDHMMEEVQSSDVSDKTIDAVYSIYRGDQIAPGYVFESTGGGCTALIHRFGCIEIYLTDGDFSAPTSFPVEYSVFTVAPDSEEIFRYGGYVYGEYELRQVEIDSIVEVSKIIEREGY